MKPLGTTPPSPTPASTFKHGFVHVVYFWLKQGLPAADVERFEKALRQLVEDSEYAVTGYVGKPAGTPREVVDNSYDYSLIVSFDDAEGHDGYQNESPHDRFRVVAKELAERVLIFDSRGVGSQA